MKSVATATIQFTLRDDGIVVGEHINPELVRTRKNVSAAFDLLDQLIEGKPRPGLWDVRPAEDFPPRAWNVFIRRLGKSISALAIIADEQVQRSIGAFPAAIDSLLIPTRVFASEAGAIEWLQPFVDD